MAILVVVWPVNPLHEKQSCSHWLRELEQCQNGQKKKIIFVRFDPCQFGN
jgi:hypothetical protein